MNKCKTCGTDTINKYYCSMKCRDTGRAATTKEDRLCVVCSAAFTVYRRSKKRYCSCKCSASDENVKTNKLNTMRNTNIERYGATSASKLESVKEKTRRTNLQKYGTEHVFQSPIVKKKITETNLDRYGVKYPQESSEIREKTKKSVMDKYDGFTFQSNQLRSKAIDTMVSLYGSSVPLQNKDIIDKTRTTNLKKYGVEWGLSSDIVREKRLNTLKSKYGTETKNVSQLQIIREKIKKTKNQISYQTVLQRIPTTIIPLFERHEFSGVGYYDTLYSFKCNDCNTVFETYLYGGNIPICRKCNPSLNGTSVAEIEIGNFLEELGILVERNARNVISPLELDLWLPEKNIAIEYNGIYWHSEISGGKDKWYHLNKTQLCEEKGIQLIQIFEDEWITKKDIVKNRLRHIIGNVQLRLYARSCLIKQISASEANQFLNEHHIQGKDKSSIRYGAYFKNELVSVMTFGKQRRVLGNKKNSNNEYEMIRFCVGKHHVVGIANRLFMTFVREYSPSIVVSYADRRWTTLNNVYNTLGFELVSSGTPNYWYVGNGNIREYRFNYRKHVLRNKLNKYDSTLSEWENMKTNGYDRIWDCGSFKFEWNYQKN